MKIEPGMGSAQIESMGASAQLRQELADLYRVVAHLKMTDLIYTHISVRLPGPDHQFLINRYGVLFHEMTPADLIRVDVEGNVLSDTGEVLPSAGNASSWRLVNAAGFTIHSAVHMARPEVQCVLHTHTAAGIAVSAQRKGLLPISQHALRFYGCLSYHDYEGIALDLEERERLIADLGSNQAMILRNHGLLVAGRSVAEAFSLIYYLERACQAQVVALAGGAELIEPPPDVCARTARQFAPANALEHHEMAWQAALRLARA